ncbi:MAG: DUF2304 family protein [Myxococcales bacterium]|nr:DUF2304 family protein [Myxococcales bacterium]
MLVQIVFVPVLLAALMVTWRRAIQRVIKLSEAFVWTLIWGGAAVTISLPGVSSTLARIAGVGRGVDFIVYASVAVLYLLVFRLFVEHVRVERQLTLIVRREALRDLPQANDRSQHVA